MKKFLKVFGVAGLLGAMMMVAGCGDDRGQGTVTKGPVAGASVYYKKDGLYLQMDKSLASTKTNALKAVTDAAGKYPVIEGFAVETESGTYYDLRTKLSTPAPALQAPAGAANVTALTTLVAKAPTAAAAQALIASFAKLGVSYDSPLDAVTSTNKAAVALNEVVGTILASNPAAADVTTLATNLVTQLSTATTSTTPAQIATAVTTAATGTPISALSSSITAVTTAVTALPVGALPTPSNATGSTGSSGGTSK